jgi:hypothetical protein
MNTDTVVVQEDLESPLADAGPEVELSCAEPEISLGGSGSQGAGFEYSWSGPGLLSGAQSLSPLVNAPGSYILTVLNQQNGCSATSQTEVFGDVIPPQISLSPPALLTCEQSQVQLDATGSSSEPFVVYQWSSSDGQILSGASSPLALVKSEIEEPPAAIASVMTSLIAGARRAARAPGMVLALRRGLIPARLLGQD